MLNVLFRRATPLACACLLWMPATSAAEAEPAAKAAATPFETYQGWRDEPLQDWREVNDRVGEIGGWRTYLRESQQDGDGADSGETHHGNHGH